MALKNMTGNVGTAPVYTSRWAERDARRRENMRLARKAAAARSGRSVKSVKDRVEKAKAVLANKNVTGAIATIQGVAPTDVDVYILAERHGQARRGVLRAFGPPRGSVERQYLAEAGLGSPEDTPDEGAEE